MPQKLLVTSALPYANGPIHFGHMVGAYLPADVYVRWHRLRGNEVLFICGTDEHGVAITFAAEAAGVEPRAYVDRWHRAIKDSFDRMGIEFDHFSRTTIPEHARISQEFFLDLLKNGHIMTRAEKQHFCPRDGRFLPDRYVTGTCPNCGAPGARGDECGKCGKWLDALTLIDPRCKICGSIPEIRESTHWFLKLQDFEPRLREWIRSQKHWKDNVVRFVEGMFAEGLRERPITRDLPWGVPVPLPEAKGKVLYVWFDAPIGYVSATMEWAARRGTPDAWKAWWLEPEAVKLVHFIGKDNIPFHAIVFPAMLMGQTRRWVLPWNVPANEFYNLEGRKFSTSGGWFIDIAEALARHPVDALRYALLASLPEGADTDFTWRDYQVRLNTELADTLGNLVTRILKFIEQSFGGRVPAAARLDAIDQALLDLGRAVPDRVGALVEGFQIRNALREVMAFAGAANKYLDDQKPWVTRKTDVVKCGTTLHVGCQALRTLAILLGPFLPGTSAKVWAMLGLGGRPGDEGWKAFDGKVEAGRPIGKSEVLFVKMEDDQAAAEVARLKAQEAESGAGGAKPAAAGGSTPAAAPAPAATAAPAATGGKPVIEYDDFAKLEFRVGKILAADEVPKSDRLFRLDVDVGTEKRQVLAGIRGSYTAAELIGREVVVLVNLKPRKMMGTESQGMVLAAEVGGRSVLLALEKPVGPGAGIK